MQAAGAENFPAASIASSYQTCALRGQSAWCIASYAALRGNHSSWYQRWWVGRWTVVNRRAASWKSRNSRRGLLGGVTSLAAHLFASWALGTNNRATLRRAPRAAARAICAAGALTAHAYPRRQATQGRGYRAKAAPRQRMNIVSRSVAPRAARTQLRRRAFCRLAHRVYPATTRTYQTLAGAASRSTCGDIALWALGKRKRAAGGACVAKRAKDAIIAPRSIK